ncbi:glycosyltransferase family 2 protein [Alteriqipengyuania lutimaris]|uniref:Glycosyltransferase family 2 protein n=1 Tax=Alteriqipengyuania lutimaris TaxID=1538146 RepID=A0A395LPT3_9SPHN|nr:glycosyltransferase family 2 protein [Alteriqipengyuania lutimaris]MBB3034378.1 glycosyltransferase involved in cell wall biosynthesis [Alteriqipengyuania lutimaris]RDS76720.1 glycosyltransferase family 2 protein [Alteriqipengyuania lutimaris]
MKVTIGLPFYNAEKDLPDAIRSIFAQTHQDWELILVDDGSTDRSLDIARSVDDPRVRVISDGENRRLAARLNQIVDEAQTPVIVRMDADDLMATDRIERQLAVLESMPQVDLVSTGLVSIDDDDQPFGARSHPASTMTREDLLRKAGTGIVHASVIGRRAWFQRNRYDPTYPSAQDYELWLRSSSKDDLAVHIIREPLYFVRELGSVTAAKMFRAYRMDRRSLRRNRRTVGEARYILRSFLKTGALAAIVATGRLEWLTRRRSQPMDDPALAAWVRSEIAKIRAHDVPGL